MESLNNTIIFFHSHKYFKTSHLHLFQVENCDSNSRLVVDEDVKFSPESFFFN